MDTVKKSSFMIDDILSAKEKKSCSETRSSGYDNDSSRNLSVIRNCDEFLQSQRSGLSFSNEREGQKTDISASGFSRCQKNVTIQSTDHKLCPVSPMSPRDFHENEMALDLTNRETDKRIQNDPTNKVGIPVLGPLTTQPWTKFPTFMEKLQTLHKLAQNERNSLANVNPSPPRDTLFKGAFVAYNNALQRHKEELPRQGIPQVNAFTGLRPELHGVGVFPSLGPWVGGVNPCLCGSPMCRGGQGDHGSGDLYYPQPTPYNSSKPDGISVPVPLPVYVRTRDTGGADGGIKPKKCRRSRTVFSELQLMGLEKKFDEQKYLSTPDRMELAETLGLTQLQVKTWYQNRRMKWKKQVMQCGGTEPPTKPKGRPRKYPPPDAGDDVIQSGADVSMTSSLIACDVDSDFSDDEHLQEEDDEDEIDVDVEVDT